MNDKTKQQRVRARLGFHRGGVIAPTAAQLVKHTFTQNGHTFIQLGARRTISDADHQVYVRDRYGGSFNLVRLLLERAGRLEDGRGWENTCGFSECVDITHWRPRLPFKGASTRYRIIALPDDAQLYFDNARVRRDAVLPVVIAPARDVPHLARFLYSSDGGSRFVTACGININPATLVPVAKATCPSCLS